MNTTIDFDFWVCDNLVAPVLINLSINEFDYWVCDDMVPIAEVNNFFTEEIRRRAQIF